jgi:hypothetical protein
MARKLVPELMRKKRMKIPMIGCAVIIGSAFGMMHLGFPEEVMQWIIMGETGLFGGASLNNAAADFGKEAK